MVEWLSFPPPLVHNLSDGTTTTRVETSLIFPVARDGNHEILLFWRRNLLALTIYIPRYCFGGEFKRKAVLILSSLPMNLDIMLRLGCFLVHPVRTLDTQLFSTGTLNLDLCLVSFVGTFGIYHKQVLFSFCIVDGIWFNEDPISTISENGCSVSVSDRISNIQQEQFSPSDRTGIFPASFPVFFQENLFCSSTTQHKMTMIALRYQSHCRTWRE